MTWSCACITLIVLFARVLVSCCLLPAWSVEQSCTAHDAASPGSTPKSPPQPLTSCISGAVLNLVRLLSSD